MCHSFCLGQSRPLFPTSSSSPSSLPHLRIPLPSIPQISAQYIKFIEHPALCNSLSPHVNCRKLLDPFHSGGNCVVNGLVQGQVNVPQGWSTAWPALPWEEGVPIRTSQLAKPLRLLPVGTLATELCDSHSSSVSMKRFLDGWDAPVLHPRV